MDCLNRNIRILLTLLRAGLWECVPDELSFFPLDREAWKEVYRISCEQTVTGWVYRGICQLPDECLPPMDLLAKWVVRTDAIERYNGKMNEVLEELVVLFKAEGVEPVLQKGQGLACLYKYPLLRQCGDIDLYFYDVEQWRKANRCLKEAGVKKVKSADGGFYYDWKGMIVEHHTHLFDLASPFKQKSLKVLERRFGYVHSSLVGNGNVDILLPAPVLNVLLLNTHILKHFLGKGIGLRQLCDMARAYWFWQKEIHKVDMEAIYRNLGLFRWNEVLHDFLIEYLGLASHCLPYRLLNRNQSSVLMNRVLEGGNFGQFESADSIANTAWQRKIHTFWAFGKHMKTSCLLCPDEAIWTVLNLMKGQMV